LITVKKIVTVVGARPQLIKAALVSKWLKKSNLDEILVHTGQHYDFLLSEVFFRDLKLPAPRHCLDVGSASHGQQTARMLAGVEEVLLSERPQMAMVYGDTNSTLAGALAAAKLRIPLIHVEAGLRSHNRAMPEEINRLLTDHVADLLFAPTPLAVGNLKREGIRQGVHLVGDVMYDLALEVKTGLDEEAVLKKMALKKKEYILTTIHRAENTDQRENLAAIWSALMDIAASGIMVLFPAHPRTRQALRRFDLMGQRIPAGLRLVEPVSYPEMIALESQARLIITDSGGVQKEGYFFKTPCLIPRRETEWQELVQAGWNILTGASRATIRRRAQELYHRPIKKPWRSLYGRGRAGREIARIVKDY